jgi:general secretion pathway protein L
MTIAAHHWPKVTRARARASRALAWWLGELAAAGADAARWFGAGERGAITLEAGERYWILRQRQHAIGQLDRHSHPDDARRALETLIPAGSRPRTLIVAIPPERVLSRTVSFPAGARAELERIVEFEIARHFPFPASRVFYRYRVIGRPGGTGASEIAVQIAAVPRDLIASIHDELAAFGLRANGVALIAGDDAEPLLLPSEALSGTGAAAPPAARPALVVAVAVLAVMAVAAWPLAQHFRLASLDRELATLKPEAEAVLQRRVQAQNAAERAAAVLRLKATRPPLVALVDTLSRELPDGSWLLSLSVSGNELVIDGLSPSAATIALALEHGGSFTKIEFRSPISREPNGLEHFRLGATIAEAKP